MSVRSFSTVPSQRVSSLAQLPAVAVAMQAAFAAANSVATAMNAAARRARATSAFYPEMPETL